jgi:hypothetical protein
VALWPVVVPVRFRRRLVVNAAPEHENGCAKRTAALLCHNLGTSMPRSGSVGLKGAEAFSVPWLCALCCTAQHSTAVMLGSIEHPPLAALQTCAVPACVGLAHLQSKLKDRLHVKASSHVKCCADVVLKYSSTHIQQLSQHVGPFAPLALTRKQHVFP